MASGNSIVYSKNKAQFKLADLVSATVKLALLKSTYTPDTSVTGHSLWAEISAEEIAAGNGYPAGGFTLSTKAIVAITNGYKLNADNVSVTATGGPIPAWRYGVLYVAGSLWSMTDPALGVFIGDTAPADVPATPDGNPLLIKVPTLGWLNVT